VAGVVEHVRQLDACVHVRGVLRDRLARGVGALLLLGTRALHRPRVGLHEAVSGEQDEAQDGGDAGEQPDLHLDRLHGPGPRAAGPHRTRPGVELELGFLRRGRGCGRAGVRAGLGERKTALRADVGGRVVLGAAVGTADGLGHGSSRARCTRGRTRADDSGGLWRAPDAAACGASATGWPALASVARTRARPRWRTPVRSASIRFAAAWLLLLAAAPVHATETQEFTIRVLHTADLHGALAAWDDWTDKPAPRGLERIATLVKAARADTSEDSGGTLLLDAGDALFGSPLVRTWREGPRRDPEPVIA